MFCGSMGDTVPHCNPLSAPGFAPGLVTDTRYLPTSEEMPTDEQIKEALSRVIDPELRKDIVELGMVRAIERGEAGHVHVRVSLTTPGCPIRSHFEQAVSENVGALKGVTGVSTDFDVLSDSEKQRKSVV